MNGYQDKLLIADLTKEMLIDEPLNEKYARNFLGSTGLAARYLFDMVDEKTDPSETRAFHSMGLVYTTAPRRADQNKSDGYKLFA